MSGHEKLYQNWEEWVTTHLGRDPTLTQIAATAATDAAEQGSGFNGAVEAARAAWSGAVQAGSARDASIEAATIDHGRTERRAIAALAFGVAAWSWPILVVGVLVAGHSGQLPTDAAVTILVVGFWMAISVIAITPGFAVVAAVLGHSARSRIKRYGLPGRRSASAGLILGYAALVGSPLIVGLVATFAFVSVFCCYV